MTVGIQVKKEDPVSSGKRDIGCEKPIFLKNDFN